jgi:hypothetical protein
MTVLQAWWTRFRLLTKSPCVDDACQATVVRIPTLRTDMYHPCRRAQAQLFVEAPDRRSSMFDPTLNDLFTRTTIIGPGRYIYRCNISTKALFLLPSSRQDGSMPGHPLIRPLRRPNCWSS